MFQMGESLLYTGKVCCFVMVKVVMRGDGQCFFRVNERI